MKLAFDIIDRESLSDGFLKLKRYRLARTVPGGEADTESPAIVDWECIEGLRAAAVLPYDPSSGQIVLVEQLRVGALHSPGGGLLWEPPGGVIEAGRSAAETALREAWEEAGCRIGAMAWIGTCRPCPGYSDETVELFCGEASIAGLPAVGGDPREGERTRVVVLELERAIHALGREPLTAATLSVCVQWLALHRQHIHEVWAGMPYGPDSKRLPPDLEGGGRVSHTYR